MKKTHLKYSSGELFEVFSNEKLRALTVITITIASLHFRLLVCRQGHCHPLHPTGSLICPQPLCLCPHQSPSLAEPKSTERRYFEGRMVTPRPRQPLGFGECDLALT